MAVSVVSHGEKSWHPGADRNRDEALGRIFLACSVANAHCGQRSASSQDLLLSEQSMKFTCSEVPKADEAPLEINGFKKALKMMILSDRPIFLSVYSECLVTIVLECAVIKNGATVLLSFASLVLCIQA